MEQIRRGPVPSRKLFIVAGTSALLCANLSDPQVVSRFQYTILEIKESSKLLRGNRVHKKKEEEQNKGWRMVKSETRRDAETLV